MREGAALATMVMTVFALILLILQTIGDMP